MKRWAISNTYRCWGEKRAILLQGALAAITGSDSDVRVTRQGRGLFRRFEVAVWIEMGEAKYVKATRQWVPR